MSTPIRTEPHDGPFDYDQRRRRPRWLYALGAVVLVGLLGAGAMLWWFQRHVSPPGSPGQEVTVTVEPGMSTLDIGRLLDEEGVITSATVFRYYVRLNGLGTVEAGDYTLRQREDLSRVVEVLESGAEIDTGTALTVPEGLTLAQVSELVGELPGRSAERFLDAAASGEVTSIYQAPDVRSLEGLVLPETYFVTDEEDEVDILRRMVRTFEEVATDLNLSSAAARLGVTPYQAVVVASLVEREARVDEDRGKVARVIYNRLEEGMPLEIDATVQFALGKQKETLLFRDLEIDSPYNTYKIPGLPPGPIAAPGRESLQAALAPTPGEWLFFVVIDESGLHGFADTLAEHNRNIALAEQKGVR